MHQLAVSLSQGATFLMQLISALNEDGEAFLEEEWKCGRGQDLPQTGQKFLAVVSSS